MKSQETFNYADLLPAKKKRNLKRKVAAEALTGRSRLRKRVGRGRSSGQGKTSGRGQKGQKARTGYSRRFGFEGGQMPLHRRIPKRGFTNIFKVDYQLVNLGQLFRAKLSGQVGPDELRAAGLIGDPKRPIRVLGHGDFSGAIHLTADGASGPALEKIKAGGGSFKLRFEKKVARKGPKVKAASQSKAGAKAKA